jgi:undecaprenyl-diphosphatase
VRGPAIVITDLGSPLAVDVVTLVAACCFALLRRAPLGLVVLLARFGELACGTVVKLLVERPRPDLLPRLTSASGASFPSGHVAGSTAAYGAIVLAVAASRVLLGVHYPTDVLGGLALGVAWAAGSFALPISVRSTARTPRTGQWTNRR